MYKTQLVEQSYREYHRAMILHHVDSQWISLNFSEFLWISMNLTEFQWMPMNLKKPPFFTFDQHLFSIKLKWPHDDLVWVKRAGAALKDKNLIWELAWWDQAFNTCFELQFCLWCINYAAEPTYATLFMQHKLAIGLELNRFEWFDF